MLTPLPGLPRLPRLPRASSKKVYLAAFYNDFGTFARKNEAHFQKIQELPQGIQGKPKGPQRMAKGSQRLPKGRQREPKGTQGKPAEHYWPSTARRLIRISPQGIEGFLTRHRFGLQSGRGGRSGGLSTAKIHDFSARVFLDRSQHRKIMKFLQF